MDSKIRLTDNARRVLERRYLVRDEQGSILETPEDLFHRVARCVAEIDVRYDDGVRLEERQELYYRMMASLDFLPNSPTLMNAGRRLGQLSACFVIPVGDSIREIFGAVSTMAEIHQSGGGTGFSFSRLRPQNDIVGSTGGVASGPVSFMSIFDRATEVVKQGGRRRGANMGVLRVDHPDILEFIAAKEGEGAFRNFNLSVAVTEKFMVALGDSGTYDLVNPRNGQVTKSLAAGDVWRRITEAAWRSGDPGVIFIDRINRANPTPAVGEIEATNPCGEQPLLPYESCNLGSINVSGLVANGSVDWERLRPLVAEGVRFLDNIIDANRYPLPEIEKITFANRKIGLGVMGFAEMLVRLGIPYASEEAVAVGRDLMAFIEEEGVVASVELGKKRGSFPNFPESIWARQGKPAMRNATVTTVAPTGTISMIAGTSSGIEPLFALAYTRTVMEGTALTEVNELFLETARLGGFYSEPLMEYLREHGSATEAPNVPPEMKRLYVTALEIPPESHIRMQAAFQAHTDNAVSKTINLPSSATPDEIDTIYRQAHELGCKGITVFRYGSRRQQVLSLRRGHAGECRVCGS